MNNKFANIATLIFALGVTSGCAVRQADLAVISAGTTVTPEVIASSPHKLQALTPLPGDYPRLRIYIEGDGRAWATSRQPSTDPTPGDSMVAKFAAEDTRPSVYLARPCQFVQTTECKKSLWTSKRFSPEVVSAYNSALDSLKVRYSANEFELVGYSGGAAIALLVAAQRSDVVGVQTIAGNIDTDAWVQLKGLTPMAGSDNPADYADQLKDLPQRHIIGARDKVVPAAVTHVYMTKVQSECAEVVEVNADHHSGYELPWKALSGTPYACLVKKTQPKPVATVGDN